MATTQDYINQLKIDKQNLVSMLNGMGVEASNNETFTSLTPKVGKIVTDPILQDKSIEITENGTQTITADEGYNGLNNVEVTTNVAGGGVTPVDPDYITDGLVSWWEGADGFDENEQWHSRVGADYISVAGRLYGTSATNPVPFGEGAVFNTGNFSMVTQTDYCIKDYTVQIVAQLAGSTSSSATNLGTLIGFNMAASPMIGFDVNCNIQCSNGLNIYHEKVYSNLKNKIFNASLNLSFAPTRNGTSGLNHLFSVNGEKWYQTSVSSATHNSKGANMTVLCYYSDAHRVCGAKLYSLRVYNRKLTEEELQHNFEIDKARFGIE